MADMSKFALVIDYKYCTGCHSCEVAGNNELELPVEEWCIKVNEIGPAKLQGKWEWNYVPVPSSLCNLCEDRVEEGKRPTCVQHCQAQCIELVPVEEVGQALVRLGAHSSAFLPVQSA